MINLAIVVVIWVGGFQAVNGSLSLGAIVAFTDYLMTILTPLTLLVSMANAFAAGFASADRVCEVFDTTPAIQDGANAIPFREDMVGKVTFQHAGFSYAGTENESVLEDINLEAEPGQTIAILGATGSGKSTLVNLIPRFYDVSAGSITIDKVDVRNIQIDSLLANISITPQETILFTGSIRENICYGNQAASEEEIVQAAKAAQAHDFIVELPAGYDTSVAQRGVNLSGGQKQRIAIARAILRKPKILILDDSTSAVDVETETRIQIALGKLLKNSTCFIVAQRISTVLNADKIIVLDNGRIAAQGTHAELIKDSPIYQEIYNSQLGDGNHLVKELFRKFRIERSRGQWLRSINPLRPSAMRCAMVERATRAGSRRPEMCAAPPSVWPVTCWPTNYPCCWFSCW